MATIDGGPAFPQSDLSNYGIGPSDVGNGGMSLRDWFAGQALAGMCGHPQGLSQIRPGDLMADARLAYRFADAMLAVRESPNDPA